MKNGYLTDFARKENGRSVCADNRSERGKQFELESLYAIIQRSLQRIAKVTTPTFFSMHVAQYNIEAGGSKYSIRVIMDISKKKIFAKSHNWNLRMATDEVM
jgi:hypothetical protein